jgi:hypothetical protein
MGEAPARESVRFAALRAREQTVSFRPIIAVETLIFVDRSFPGQ